MRYAEEILRSTDKEGLMEYTTMIYYEHAIKAINEARKEAIEECISRVKITDSYQEARRLGLRGDNLEGYVRNNPNKVDKESILSLIKEIK